MKLVHEKAVLLVLEVILVQNGVKPNGLTPDGYARQSLLAEKVVSALEENLFFVDDEMEL